MRRKVCLSLLRQFSRPEEHRVKHGLGENAGEGVLLGGMVAAKKGETGGQRVLGTVSEFRFRPDFIETQCGVPGEGA